MPSSSNAARSSSPANGSRFATSRSPPSTTVTSARRVASTPAPSRPRRRRRRAPRIARERGAPTSRPGCPTRGCRGARRSAGSRRRSGGEHDRAARFELAHLARRDLDVDPAFAGQARVATDQRPARALEPLHLALVVPVARRSRRGAAAPRRRRASPVTASPRPGTLRTSASTSPGRSNALLGMHAQ